MPCWFSDRDFYVPRIPPIPKIPKLPKLPKMPQTGHFYIGDRSGSYIGVHMMELNKQLAEYFGVEKGRGVLVTEVEKKSPAGRWIQVMFTRHTWRMLTMITGHLISCLRTESARKKPESLTADI